MQSSERQPIFNVPGVIVWLIGLLVLVHVGRQFLAPSWDGLLLLRFAFIPARFGEAGGALPGEPWAGPASFFTHALLHGDWVHLGLNSAWLLAVGTPIARRMPAVLFIAFAGLCAAGGALLFLALHPGQMVPMVGASGAISGLMGALFRLLFAAEDAYDQHLLRERPAELPRLSLGQVFTRRRSLVAIVVWVGINMLASLGLGGIESGGGIAWEAHLGGFFAGMLMLDLFDRGRGPRHEG